MKYYKQSIFLFILLIVFTIIMGASLVFMIQGKVSFEIGGKVAFISFALSIILFRILNEIIEIDTSKQMQIEAKKNKKRKNRSRGR